VIYKYGLDHVPKHLAEDLYRRYTAFEKQHGDRGSIDLVILSKRRFQFEEVGGGCVRVGVGVYGTGACVCVRVRESACVLYACVCVQELKSNPHNFDVWFDFVKLEESNGNVDKVRVCVCACV